MQFSAELFDLLASAASVRSDPTKGEAEQAGGGFTQRGIREIEKYKDAVFKVMMLRARNFMKVTPESKLSEDRRFALIEFRGALVTDDIHSDEKVSTLRIPTRVLGGHFDDDEIEQELARFGDVYLLACTTT